MIRPVLIGLGCLHSFQTLGTGVLTPRFEGLVHRIPVKVSKLWFQVINVYQQPGSQESMGLDNLRITIIGSRYV